ncbi:glycosyltransferase family 2 protein [Hydrogenophaga palleronii]|uniref:glycosyltransferase family 2 protein n=1 Tax=Hydrogenophaga palleronii TaxID=65655 RepID=UPI0009FEC4A8|nr:glycosyltransferase family 2 protein [Hydrogenophaga palleronii]
MNPKLSIVSTLYKSQNYVEQFLDEALKAGEGFCDDFEILLVDDGSPDASRALAEKRASLDSRVKVIQLTRNFGHHPAFWCGMHHAKGDYCFLIDSDLEVNPQVLADFKLRMEEDGADVVYGVQDVRKGATQTRVLGGAFWRIFSALSNVDVPQDIMTERLMKRPYLDALLSMQDYNLFLGGMFYWPGFQQTPLKLIKQPRSGRGAYSALDRFKLLVEAISSFSSFPLTLIFWLGAIVSLFSATYSIYLLARRLLFPETVLDGFTFLALVSVGSAGMILVALGVIGLYIHRIFKQVQARPIFIVKQIYSKK